jgi:hypothetical protein
MLPRVMSSILLLLLLLATPANASTIDQRRLAAHEHAAEVAFPVGHDRTVHLNAGAIIDRTFPACENEEDGSDCTAYGMKVFGFATDAAYEAFGSPFPPYQIYLRRGMDRGLFRYTLFHEMAHTAGWEHGPAMNRAVNRALRRASRSLKRR